MSQVLFLGLFLFSQQTFMKIKLAKGIHLKISKDGFLTYAYDVYRGMSFDFTILSEVGEIFKPIYQDYFEKNNYKIETVEFDDEPYLQDRILNL